jgi:DNA (cytosine-5)-methyltransferase 1
VSKRKVKFIDLFSGAGGFSCGLEMAGFECMLGVDFNKDAIDTFQANHLLSKSYCGDIKKLTNKKIDKFLNGNSIDLIVGGPPCQGFSTVGTGNPDDKRNSLFKEFLRIVKHLTPNYVVMENVTGLLARKNEQSLIGIFKLFKNMGYKMDVKILSADEFGVPEIRRRTIFIASKVNADIIFPKKTHGQTIKSPKVTVDQAINNLKGINDKIHNHDLKSCEVKDSLDLRRLKRLPEGKGIRYKKDEDQFLTKSLKYDVDWEKLPEKRFRQARLQRLNGSALSPTIMTHRHSYYHPRENRLISAREAAAIQSFPNDFVFHGSVTSQWRQIGNAVPPRLAFSIAGAIKKMIQQSKKPMAFDKNFYTKNQILEKIKNERKLAFNYRC